MKIRTGMASRRAIGRRTLGAALIIVATTAVVSVAAAATHPDLTQDDDATAKLRDRIRARYDVIPLESGIALTPKRKIEGLRLIEISDGTVAINGTVVSGGELRDKLGSDADLVLRLSYLDADARRTLFEEVKKAAEPTIEVPEPPTVPREPEPSMSYEDRHRGAVVQIGRNVTISEHEFVEDVVAVLGSAQVDGRTRGDVVVVLGSLLLGPKADVGGEVTVVGGSIHRAPGARVRRGVNHVGIGAPNFNVGQFWRHGGAWPYPGFFQIAGVLGTVFRMVLMAFLASVIVLVARDSVERTARYAGDEPLKAGFVGLLAQLLFLPILVVTIVLLAISIIGIPLLLLIPFVIIGLLLLWLLGFAGVCYRVGHWAARRFGWTTGGPFLTVATGVATIMAMTLLARVVTIGDGMFAFFGIVLLILGFFIEYAAWTVGFGSVLLARFGRRTDQPTVAPPGAIAAPSSPPQTG